MSLVRQPLHADMEPEIWRRYGDKVFVSVDSMRSSNRINGLLAIAAPCPPPRRPLPQPHQFQHRKRRTRGLQGVAGGFLTELVRLLEPANPLRKKSIRLSPSLPCPVPITRNSCPVPLAQAYLPPTTTPTIGWPRLFSLSLRARRHSIPDANHGGADNDFMMGRGERGGNGVGVLIGKP